MLRLAIRVAREQSELVLAELLELAPSGVEEVEQADGAIEYAVYGPPGELPALPDLRAAAGGALIDVSTSEVADDWSDRWRQFHRPLVLGDRLVVRPPWEPLTSARIDLVIDPGQAFGTGAHASTRLCLEALLDLAPGERFLDLGCGSGVLAIAARKLGWASVTALDHDPAAVSATAENARRNQVEIEVGRLDLREAPTPAADAVAANLLAPLLRIWVERLLERHDRRPGLVIASGVLCEEADDIAGVFARVGLRETARRELAGWAALLLVAR